MLDDSLSPALHLVVSEQAKATFDQFESITARVRGGKEVVIVIQATGKSTDLGQTLAGKSEEALKLLRTHLDKFIPDAARQSVADEMLKGFRISRKDAVVTLTGKLSEANARKLLAVVPQKKER